MRARQAVVVADLGFGDAGKGTMTDWLVRCTGSKLVVRYNGGAQAGHTVVTGDGRRHTFAQMGAGSFVEGVRTHLSRHMIVHPGGLLVEAAALARVGVGDALARLSIHPEALLISPFQQAACRLREVLRGPDRHGSCGIGVGETVWDLIDYPADSIRAVDLGEPALVRRKLARQQARKWAEFSPQRAGLGGDGSELAVLESRDAGERWLESARLLFSQIEILKDALPDAGTVIFEGAQGVLLDEWRGFHPHTTWSTCTFDNALAMLSAWDGDVMRLGVTRAYATRHGAGPFPTEDKNMNLAEPDNHHGPWQGAFRVGWPDLVLLRYAIAACGGIDALAVTHLDRVQLDWRLATGYRDGDLKLGPFKDLAYQEGLTRELQAAQPIYQSVDSQLLVATLEAELGAPVWVESRGPRAKDKRETEISQFAALCQSRL